MILSLRKQWTFHNTNTGFPAKRSLRNKCGNSVLMTCHYHIWVVLLIGWKFGCPIRSTSQIWVVTHQSREFLRSFLRFHFVGKPVAALWNVACFLFSQARWSSTLSLSKVMIVIYKWILHLQVSTSCLLCTHLTINRAGFCWTSRFSNSQSCKYCKNNGKFTSVFFFFVEMITENILW